MELLVSAALVGGMGLLLLPSLTNGQIQQKDWNARLESTMGSIENAAAEAAALGETNPYLALRNRLKVMRECPTDAVTELCWTALQGYADEGAGATESTAEEGLILKNGVVLYGLLNTTLSNTNLSEDIILDANGAAPPNVPSKDQLRLAVCFDNQGCTGTIFADLLNTNNRWLPNKLVVYTNNANSYALYQKLYN
jgi:type II secretory pathway pseudopilin PulG